MPPEEIDVTNSGIVEDEKEPVEKGERVPDVWAERVRKRTGRGRIDVSLDGISEGATDHYPGVEKSADPETVEDRLIKSEQRQRERFFREWSLGPDPGTKPGEIDLGESDVVKASLDPEGYAEEQEQKRREREKDELAEEIADELETRFTRAESRREVRKSETSETVDKCRQAKAELNEIRELVLDVKADVSA